MNREHEYQDIPARDEVNIFLEGIKNPEYNSCILKIKYDPAMMDNFEVAQATVCELSPFREPLENITPWGHVDVRQPQRRRRQWPR